jgi:hypothetical protein
VRIQKFVGRARPDQEPGAVEGVRPTWMGYLAALKRSSISCQFTTFHQAAR